LFGFLFDEGVNAAEQAERNGYAENQKEKSAHIGNGYTKINKDWDHSDPLLILALHTTISG